MLRSETAGFRKLTRIRPGLALISAASITIGCQGTDSRVELEEPARATAEQETSSRPADETPAPSPLVPEFRLRLEPRTHTLHVRLELDAAVTDTLHLLFRTEWEGYPGLADRLREVEAWGETGALPVETVAGGLGPGHRRIPVPGPGHVTVAYRMVLTPEGDSRFYHRVSQLSNDGGHLIGNDVFPRVWLSRPHAGAQPARVWFTGTPPHWRVATVERRTGTGYRVDEILSAVFVVGELHTRRLNIGPRSLTVAVYGRWPVSEDRVVDAVGRIAGNLHRMAGDGWAAGDYGLAAGRVPESVPGLSTGGQVIGHSGIVYVGGTGPAEYEFENWTYTTAHELLHWYIPTAFRFRQAPPPSWFAEGFTDYMALKTLLVGQLIDPRQFLQEIGVRFARYRDSPLYGTRSITEAQADFWEDDAYRYIYDGGAAAAFLLDLGFQGRGGSLERVLATVRRGNPVTVASLTAALTAARENLWLEDWLAFGNNPDWEVRFSQYGLAWNDNTLVGTNDWATDALSSIRP